MSTFSITVTALAIALWPVTATAEAWTRLDSADPRFAVEFSKSSIQDISPTAKRARVRFISKSGGAIPQAKVYSVVCETEFYCLQPLEKLLSAQIVSQSGEASPPQVVDPAVYNEIPHGSNLFMLWKAICSGHHDSSR